ncbi:MAG: Rad52/Rad22 family DNA repair protein [Deltaproteobacteria bacterium]|nr:Rad52/Rad22 family DNA repair protein [Deltaproteobacteria bacterium]
MMGITNLTALAEPIRDDEVAWRAGHIVAGKGARSKPSVLLIPCINRHAVIRRLNAAFGPLGWSAAYESVGGGFVCRLTVRDGDRETTHEDVGVPSSSEPLKGGYSDSLKRVASNLGIGASISTIRDVWSLDFAERPPRGADRARWIRISEKKAAVYGYALVPRLDDVQHLPAGLFGEAEDADPDDLPREDSADEQVGDRTVPSGPDPRPVARRASRSAAEVRGALEPYELPYELEDWLVESRGDHDAVVPIDLCAAATAWATRTAGEEVAARAAEQSGWDSSRDPTRADLARLIHLVGAPRPPEPEPEAEVDPEPETSSPPGCPRASMHRSGRSCSTCGEIAP